MGQAQVTQVSSAATDSFPAARSIPTLQCVSIGRSRREPNVVATVRKWIGAVCLIGGLGLPAAASGQPIPTPTCRVHVVGFMGGHILPEWMVLSGFQSIARSIRDLRRPDICVRTFPGVLAPRAFRWIRRSFSADDRRLLTASEVAEGPAIVIYGYSSGGWSALGLARRLGKEGIPVELVVQVDTPWFGKSLVPPNVKIAANFYQHRTWLPALWGTSRVRAEQPAHTMLFNVRIPKVGHFGMPRLSQVRDMIVGTVLVQTMCDDVLCL